MKSEEVLDMFFLILHKSLKYKKIL